jgi:CubicO group peptidase (beta-lactamase class C family)
MISFTRFTRRLSGAKVSLAVVGFVCASPLLDTANAQATLPRVLKAVTKLENETNREMRKSGLPGLAIAVVYNDRLIYSRGFGVREKGKLKLVNANTVFQLASLSKPIGSTVMASLVSRDFVQWDSKIADLDPDFAMYDPAVTSELTIGDLYSHRSGLPGHIGDILEDIGYSREEILYRLRYQPPAGTFREYYAYTNFGMTEGAVAASKEVGLPWETISYRSLYRPLGMDSTSSTFADFLSRKNRAVGYSRIDGKWVHVVQREPDAQSPAGGVSSNVLDMAKWMRLQINGGTFQGKRVVDEDALAETHKPHMVTDSGGTYGYGWNVSTDPEGRLRISHSGAFTLGAGTCVTIIPEEKLGIVILTNGEAFGLAEGLAANFMDNVLYGSPRREWLALYMQAFQDLHDEDWAMSRQYDVPPVSPAPPLAASVYEGTYSNSFYGPARVVQQNGGLVLLLGPNERPYPLKHWDGNTYTYLTDGEMGAGNSGVFFTVETGVATEVRIEFFDKNSNGTLKRVVEK